MEAGTDLGKSIEISVQAEQPALTLHHWIENKGLWPVELAPWALTQLPLGGVAVLPQDVASADFDPCRPNRHLVLWPSAHWHDSRLHLDDDYVLIDAEPQLPPFKVGYFNNRGWVGYLRRDVFFRKRFGVQPDATYPDWGCNVEYYCNDMFMEMETLGPMCRLEPGQCVTHTEQWEFLTGLALTHAEDEVRSLVRGLSGSLANSVRCGQQD